MNNTLTMKKPLTMDKTDEKKKTSKALVKLLAKILIIAIVATVLLTVVGGLFISHDNNMFPAVGDGDLAITYRLGAYRTGDIVVYENQGENLFGRIVATEGDIVEINEDGQYKVNGLVPYETIYFETRPAESLNITYPYTVKEGEVFILNDLRDNDSDSRSIGGVSHLKGKVVLLIRRRGF